MTILIAHNEAAHARVIKNHLIKNGYQVLISRNVADAIVKVDKNHPDIIISDLSVSNATFNLIDQLKSNELNKLIPILIVSKPGQENMVEKAFEMGADDYLSQPDRLVELSIRVSLLAKHRLKAVA